MMQTTMTAGMESALRTLCSYGPISIIFGTDDDNPENLDDFNALTNPPLYYAEVIQLTDDRITYRATANGLRWYQSDFAGKSIKNAPHSPAVHFLQEKAKREKDVLPALLTPMAREILIEMQQMFDEGDTDPYNPSLYYPDETRELMRAGYVTTDYRHEDNGGLTTLYFLTPAGHQEALRQLSKSAKATLVENQTDLSSTEVYDLTDLYTRGPIVYFYVDPDIDDPQMSGWKKLVSRGFAYVSNRDGQQIEVAITPLGVQWLNNWTYNKSAKTILAEKLQEKGAHAVEFTEKSVTGSLSPEGQSLLKSMYLNWLNGDNDFPVIRGSEDNITMNELILRNWAHAAGFDETTATYQITQAGIDIASQAWF